ncbi:MULTISPECIES: Rad52/Rad22 family DNA repair protein [Providencia]|uniref:Rad52/Rad22 family DNA repair protein n=1 Tax=Providencia TaxID=586 RepID=UPI00065DC208|nr:Rad52/Rad22 family DNA repair protein [Providencia rettgeri]
MDLLKLDEPFTPEDIEWRVQQSGKTSKGACWAMVLAYVTNRAIQKRLDEVCGKQGWKNEFTPAPDKGVMCGISIKIDNEWITKWDGAENTAVEAVKGGMSGSMKRAAVQWGIGRYLYQLEESFTKCVTEKPKEQNGWVRAKTKDGTIFWWQIPTLPSWALPPVKAPQTELKHQDNIQQEAETPLDGFTDYLLKATSEPEIMDRYKETWNALEGNKQLQDECHRLTGIRINELKKAA